LSGTVGAVGLSRYTIDLGTTVPSDAGIEYHVHNVATMPYFGEFDLVTASCSPMRRIASSWPACAVPSPVISGRVAVLSARCRTRHTIWERPLDTRYGFAIHWTPEMRDGDRLAFDLYLGTTLHLECRHWTLDTYCQSLQDGGLSDVEFHPWLPGRGGIDELGADFWQPWLENPMLRAVTGRKA
jgi:hypothetical protein